MRQAGTEANDFPSNDAIDEFRPLLKALVERRFPVPSPNPSKLLEDPGSGREEAVSDDQTAVAPSEISTRRWNRSRTLTAKARKAISDVSNSSLRMEFAEKMPVPKDASVTFSVISDNAVQAPSTPKMTGEQLDSTSERRPADTTKKDARQIQESAQYPRISL